MKILVVSGFLGVGKTTFIKEMIRRSKKKFVVLENEYGEVNLDSQQLRTVSEMNIFEMTEGCVCCSMKDSFVNSILAISGSLDPDYLIVEPTGIGKLSNIIENIKKVEYEKIKLVGSIALISPQTLLRLEKDYQDIYLDQMKNASHIVFSKCEHEEPAFFDQASQQIHIYNPDISIYKGHYKNLNDQWWDDLWLSHDVKIIKENSENISLDTLTLYHPKISHIGEFVFFLEEMLRGKYGKIIRAKGLVQCQDIILRFDLADKQYAIIESNIQNNIQSVFIGSYLNKIALSTKLKASLNSSPVKKLIRK
ncbi:hypothetical protein B7939_01910 [Eggerthia catenaformis]|nr:hypothetical protein B7939_01910 [Eggerthia catenaformis]